MLLLNRGKNQSRKTKIKLIGKRFYNHPKKIANLKEFFKFNMVGKDLGGEFEELQRKALF